MPNAASTPYFFFLNLLLGVLVSQCSWNPLSTEVVGTGVSGELEHGSLGILARGDDLLKGASEKRDQTRGEDRDA